MNLGIRKPNRTRTSTVIDAMDATTGWSALLGAGQGGPGLATALSESWAMGTNAVFWNGGGAGSGIAKTIASTDLSAKETIAMFVRAKDISNAPTGAALTVRIGTSSSVYWQKIVDGATFPDRAWILVGLSRVKDFSAVGGISAWTAITYIELQMNTASSGQCFIDNIVAL